MCRRKNKTSSEPKSPAAHSELGCAAGSFCIKAARGVMCGRAGNLGVVRRHGRGTRQPAPASATSKERGDSESVAEAEQKGRVVRNTFGSAGLPMIPYRPIGAQGRSVCSSRSGFSKLPVNRQFSESPPCERRLRTDAQLLPPLHRSHASRVRIHSFRSHWFILQGREKGLTTCAAHRQKPFGETSECCRKAALHVCRRQTLHAP